MFEKGFWICSSCEDSEQSIIFRKAFKTNDEVSAARLCISALGIGVCTINGKRVSDERFITPKTRYDKWVLYQKYDVTNLICKGENVIAVHVGNGSYHAYKSSSWYDVLKLMLELRIEFEDGRSQTIVTDKSWKFEYGPCIYNYMTQGEIYDARLRKYGFDTSEYDDSNWKHVIIANEPGGRLEPMNMPPERVCEILEPINKKENIYDFGVNTSGCVQIVLTGSPGQQVRLVYDELLNDDGKFAGYINAFNKNNRLKHEDIFICSGSEKEEYSAEFCLHGFRYVMVENAPEDFCIKALTIHTDLQMVGDFCCSDNMINKIHCASVRSTLTNYHSIPTDCPHREQNGWTCDAMIAAEQSIMNFDMENVYRKWLGDFCFEQRPNGQLPGIVPYAACGYNWGNGPAWDSALILVPWYLYLENRKTDIIEHMWQYMARSVKYLYRRSYDHIADFGLGDWMPPEHDDGSKSECPIAVTNTAILYLLCKTMAKMAAIIGENSYCWEDMAINVKRAWRNNFLNNRNLYKFQTYYACAIFCGIFEKSEVQGMADRLAQLVIDNDYHIDCGFLGAKCIFSALSDYGHAEVVYKMITNPTYPSYAYWINNNMTTLCESWQMKDSVNHQCFSEIDNWLYKYIGGIHFTENGILIKPIKIKEIKWAEVRHRGILVKSNSDSVIISTDTKVVVDLPGVKKELDAGEYKFDF